MPLVSAEPAEDRGATPSNLRTVHHHNQPLPMHTRPPLRLIAECCPAARHAPPRHHILLLTIPIDILFIVVDVPPILLPVHIRGEEDVAVKTRLAFTEDGDEFVGREHGGGGVEEAVGVRELRADGAEVGEEIRVRDEAAEGVFLTRFCVGEVGGGVRVARVRFWRAGFGGNVHERLVGVRESSVHWVRVFWVGFTTFGEDEWIPAIEPSWFGVVGLWNPEAFHPLRKPISHSLLLPQASASSPPSSVSPASRPTAPPVWTLNLIILKGNKEI